LIATRSLMESKALNPELKVAILECFQKLLSHKTDSYENVNYVTNLQTGINNLLGYYSKNDILAQLSNYLYELHFNSELFIQFLINQYKEELSEIKDYHDKQSHLRRELGQLRKPKPTTKKPKYLYIEDTIYHCLSQFIQTEISCLGIAINKAKPTKVTISAPVPVPSRPAEYKLRFNFSVECLAYLIKLLVNANVIEPGIKAELLRYVAANFQTPGTKLAGIAAGSFETKYKNVTQSTSVTVRAALMAMLKLLDKEF
jgi:hypothetical protein